ncbi:Nitrogen regulatory protein areA [Wickerhamomyces ciferrii]|uniref:Nitrogen regulatory protein areA n=1 Tax=Wickerhamomyces ciferrii (strain ATCC 14091 / BCRC 22168 / CBS 111 / JCM 3599 / NBRC 0793 / NRRL Y-1031 F-60-10) TaxID=1206466 RepID=K0KFG7_WICCF|nr:Nitrogen regulatory protein areA [Wickerhamomyces ciferrii]CCH40972.1 Nitrogen regulatory protein areA [Wickerhamomyces ciferrii]
MNNNLEEDSSAEALWRMYSKAKASLPYKERMQNLTWRMMSIKFKRQHILPSFPESSTATSPKIKKNVFDDKPKYNPEIANGDEYLNLSEIPSLTATSTFSNNHNEPSNLTKFFLENEQKSKINSNIKTEPEIDPTSDDFDYVAHIKKIGQQEDQNNNFTSISSSFHENDSIMTDYLPTKDSNLNSQSIPILNNIHPHAINVPNSSSYNSNYLDSPGNDLNSYLDPLETISNSYDPPSNFHHISNSFSESQNYFNNMYNTQATNSPVSSSAHTPIMNDGSFFESYFNNSGNNASFARNNNNQSFASKFRRVPSMTSINNNNINDDETLMNGNDFVSNLSSSLNSRRPSTASTIRKKANIPSKLTKAKKNVSSTQLSGINVSGNNLSSSAPNKREDSTSNANTRCTNCNTQTTPLWRRNPEGQPLCNACGLFLKLHGVVRPLSLKTDVIKKRQRGSGSTSTASNNNNNNGNNVNNQPFSPTKVDSKLGKKESSTNNKNKPTVSNTSRQFKKKTPGPSSQPTPQRTPTSARGESNENSPFSGNADNEFLQDDQFIHHSNDQLLNDSGGFQFNTNIDFDNQFGNNTVSSSKLESNFTTTNNKNGESGKSGSNNNWEWLSMAL